ncbi:unnamed protein product [Knipowitschia caucasica]|uniref:Extracellular matrix protein 1 n=1 Tax=Knipowitschia caucasica TaxID=637954 RepID=A0AAV2MDG1_KNICA
MSARTWAFVCSLAVAVVRVSATSSDGLVEQREVSSDIRRFMKDNPPPESFMMQRELDLFEILNDFEKTPNPGFSPRASRPHPLIREMKYHVEFPLARPTAENLRSICLHGAHRPRYPASYFPTHGFGVHKREADAVNTLEAWFEKCCRLHNQTEEALLCCATQSWEKSINHFCKVGFALKTTHFHCCKVNRSERFPCFDSSSPNPDYSPTEDSPVQPVPPKVKFNFDHSSCSGTAVTPHSIRGQNKGKSPAAPLKVDLEFPLSAPTESNVQSICGNLKQLPHYNMKCFKGQGLAALQARSTNSLKKRFKLCCRGKESPLPCTKLSWEEEMTRFCDGCKHQRIDFPCCEGGVELNCFKNMSSNLDYNYTLSTGLSLSDVCDTHKIITKKFSGKVPLKSVVSKCCDLSPSERNACVLQSVEELFVEICSSRNSPPKPVQRCCRLLSAECFNKVLMNAITKATSSTKQRKKKCPKPENMS